MREQRAKRMAELGKNKDAEQKTEEAGEQPRAAAAPAKSASNGEMPGNFTGFEPFGGVNSFFDE